MDSFNEHCVSAYVVRSFVHHYVPCYEQTCPSILRKDNQGMEKAGSRGFPYRSAKQSAVQVWGVDGWTHRTLWPNHITPSCPAYWIALPRSERFVITSDLLRHGSTPRAGIRSVKHVVSSGYIVDLNCRRIEIDGLVKWGRLRNSTDKCRMSVGRILFLRARGTQWNFGTIYLLWWATRNGRLSKVHSRPTCSRSFLRRKFPRCDPQHLLPALPIIENSTVKSWMLSQTLPSTTRWGSSQGQQLNRALLIQSRLIWSSFVQMIWLHSSQPCSTNRWNVVISLRFFVRLKSHQLSRNQIWMLRSRKTTVQFQIFHFYRSCWNG